MTTSPWQLLASVFARPTPHRVAALEQRVIDLERQVAEAFNEINTNFELVGQRINEHERRRHKGE